MLDKIKQAEFKATEAEQAANSTMMRKKSAQYQHALVSGEMDIRISFPAFNLYSVDTVAVTTDGTKIEVTVWEAKFGNETIRRVKKTDAQIWLKSKHVLWENGEKHLRDRAIARAKLARLHDRMSRILCEIEEVVSDDTSGLLADAANVVGIAMETLTQDGQQKTIAEVKRG